MKTFEEVLHTVVTEEGSITNDSVGMGLLTFADEWKEQMIADVRFRARVQVTCLRMLGDVLMHKIGMMDDAATMAMLCGDLHGMFLLGMWVGMQMEKADPVDGIAGQILSGEDE